MALKLIEIRGMEATSRPLTSEENSHMLSVRDKLEKVHNALLLKDRPESSVIDLHHLVYLANRETFGKGDHGNTTHKTPLIIIDGGVQHNLAFGAFGYDVQTVKPEALPKKTRPNSIIITEDKLTAENAQEMIPRLAKISDVQIHRIRNTIDAEELQLKGWDARIEMYELENPTRHRRVVVHRGGTQGTIDAWVILKKLNGKKKENK